MNNIEFDKLSDVEKLALAVEEFQNEADDEWIKRDTNTFIKHG